MHGSVLHPTFRVEAQATASDGKLSRQWNKVRAGAGIARGVNPRVSPWFVACKTPQVCSSFQLMQSVIETTSRASIARRTVEA